MTAIAFPDGVALPKVQVTRTGDEGLVIITGDGKAVLRTGLIGEIDNFKVYRSNLLAITDDATHGSNAWHVLAGVKDAMTFASQINNSESLRNPDNFGELWRLLLLYGREVIMPEALSELYCAPQ